MSLELLISATFVAVTFLCGEGGFRWWWWGFGGGGFVS